MPSNNNATEPAPPIEDRGSRAAPAVNGQVGAAFQPRTAIRPGMAVTLLASAALAGCQSFIARPNGGEAAQHDELAPITVPYIPFKSPIAPPAPETEDLLVRLRERFVLPYADDPAVKRERDWYAKHPDYLTRVFDRAERYLFHIANALEERGMPADLALLPVVESAFDPFAYSHGRAAGLWQIIPGTGRRLGLEQDWWFDARRDVLESTRAALDYLQQLHEQFNGDWLLAVAGYNSGEGNVARALERARQQGQGTDFWSIKRYLPAETRTYVPRLLALRELVANPEEHGITLPKIANAPYFEVVEIEGQIDMALAAELAGVDTETLYALNPGVNRWATDPEGPHRLLVPVAQADQFKTSLASLDERERVRWSRHLVQQGDTLGGLAQRYHTTPEVLREVNGLRGNTIRAGTYLMVPHAMKSLPSYTLSADARAARTVSAQRAGERRVHVVQKGETLWSIAQAYGVSVRSLASWNAMAPGDVLNVGRELVVWQQTGPTQTTAAAEGSTAARTNVAATTEGNPRIRRVSYVVRRGDSLYSIARRFRVTVDDIAQWNGVDTDRYLQPGQRLVMYVDVTKQST